MTVHVLPGGAATNDPAFAASCARRYEVRPHKDDPKFDAFDIVTYMGSIVDLGPILVAVVGEWEGGRLLRRVTPETRERIKAEAELLASAANELAEARSTLEAILTCDHCKGCAYCNSHKIAQHNVQTINRLLGTLPPPVKAEEGLVTETHLVKVIDIQVPLTGTDAEHLESVMGEYAEGELTHRRGSGGFTAGFDFVSCVALDTEGNYYPGDPNENYDACQAFLVQVNELGTAQKVDEYYFYRGPDPAVITHDRGR